MAWTAPLTAVANASLTAAQWNASVRDNLNATAPALATTPGSIFVTTAANTIAERVTAQGTVNTNETTATTTYTNLATNGPAVTVTCGLTALVCIRFGVSNNTTGFNSWASWDVSAPSSIAASDTWSASYRSPGANDPIHFGMALIQNLVTAGTQTFTMKYRVSGGTGSFQNRIISVFPL